MKYPAFIVLILCAFLSSLQAQTSEARPPAYRFLFVVDTSTSMKRMNEFTPTIVHDLILDGIHGRMRDGDLYGVWTFDELVDVTFTEPMTWKSSEARNQAQTVDRYIRAVKYQGKPKLEEAVKRIKQVALLSDELTVLIVHDGSGVMYGTPYDVQITALYRQFYKDMSKNERPFITSFVVQNRRMTAWAVDAAGGQLSIPMTVRKSDQKEAPATNSVAKATKPPEPEAPPAPKKAPPASIIVKGPIPKPPAATNSAPAKVVPKPTSAPSVKPPENKPASSPDPTPAAPTKPQAETTPTPVSTPKATVTAVESKPPAAMTAPVETKPPSPPPAVAKTATVESAPVVTPTAPPKVEVPAPLAAKTETAPAVEPKKTEAPKTEPPKAGKVPVEKSKAEAAKAEAPKAPAQPAAPVAPAPPQSPAAPPAPVAAKAVDSAAQLAQTAVAVPPSGGPNWLKVGVGLIFLAGAILTAYLLTRRQPAHGSVISQSMKRDGQ